MVKEIRIYYEGSPLLQPGFSAFFAELLRAARTERCKIRFISSKDGSEACRDFGIALKNHANAWNILLRDSEGPHTGNLSARLCQRQGWDKSHAASIFWMVEMMESWFYADKDALAQFYGSGFAKKAMKPNPRVEEISKADLTSGLKKATKKTKAGDYFDNKPTHGAKLLAAIDPARVRTAAPNCEKIFKAILDFLSS